MNPKAEAERLAAEVKQRGKTLGAKLIGIASVDRFREAPALHQPQALLPQAQAVIVVGVVAWTDAALELTEKEIAEHWYNPYDTCEGIMAPRLDLIAFELAKFLEARGYASLPLPSTCWWRWRPYKTMPDPFAPPFAHRYAAVAAGLGEIGWHTSFMSPEYGPRQRLISLITEAPLPADPLYNGPPLCDRCMACVKACPYGRFTQEVEAIVTLDIGGKKIQVPRTNKWRCYLCYFQINPRFLPREITEEVALRITNDARVPRGGVLMDSAACLAACMTPERRTKHPWLYPHSIGRKVARKRIAPEAAQAKLQSLIQKAGVDYLYIATKKELAEQGITLEDYMPTAQAAVVYGLRVTEGLTHAAALETLKEITFEAASYLQDLGYYTLPQSRLPLAPIRAALGVRPSESVVFHHLLTALPLPGARFVARPPRRRQSLTAEGLKTLAREAGADLVGVASVERMAAIEEALSRLLKDERTFVVETEATAKVVGGDASVWTAREITRVGPRRVTELLPTAHSVLVLGLHYPYALAAQAAQPPAENIGPYQAFVYNQAQRLLLLIAQRMLKALRDAGYEAIPTFDLEGVGFPAHQGNRFAALAAGLGEIGWCGAPLTPEYGPAQRFLAIVTDAPLPPDPVYAGGRLCRECRRCVAECPVGALSAHEAIRLTLEGRTFVWGRRDRLRCEWAHRFGLVGAEGPQYMGCEVDLPPPPKITLTAFRQTLAQLQEIDLGSRLNRNFVFERCVARCAADW